MEKHWASVDNMFEYLINSSTTVFVLMFKNPILISFMKLLQQIRQLLSDWN